MSQTDELLAKVKQYESEIAEYRKRFETAPPQPPALKLDLGCGKAKKEGFLGVDVRPFPGVDVVCDLTSGTWPWPDNSVDEVNASHFLEHLKPAQRIHVANELYRVLKKTGKATITTPHWASMRAIGDLTHEWPPVCEFWFQYLNKAWRDANAPHNDEYKCDFDIPPIGYLVHEEVQKELAGRNDEFRAKRLSYHLLFHKEAAQDMQATLTVSRK